MDEARWKTAFGKRLKELRKRKGLTLQDLAYMTGHSANTIRIYEAGTRMPNAYVLSRLAAALGCTGAELLGEHAPNARLEETPPERGYACSADLMLKKEAIQQMQAHADRLQMLNEILCRRDFWNILAAMDGER